MLKRILMPLAVASLAALWACQSNTGGSSAELSSSEGAPPIDSPVAVQASSADVVNSAPESASTESSAAATFVPTEFDDNAFPPTLPGDENHSGAWLRTDCLMCHESGIQDAPLVQHNGMSKLLLSGNCRSCHVVVAEEAEPDDEFPFARNAFPPTLPTDDSHSNAWLRDDCTMCHDNGVQGAPRIVHLDMAPLLLKARCRSCHLPRVSSEELVPDLE